MPSRHRLAAIATVVAVTWSCGDGTTTPPAPQPTTLELSQTTVALDAIGATQQLSATVKDQNGQTMSGQTVTWSSAAAGVATVNSSGLVTAVGNGQTDVTASSGSLRATAAVTVAQVATQLGKVAGGAQTGEVDTQLAVAIEVELRDRLGNAVLGGAAGAAASTAVASTAVANTSVNFTVSQGGGSVADASASVGANGRASTTWTLGTATGAAHEATASLTGGSISTTFNATATAGAADSIVAESGGGQVAPENLALPDSLVVRVADRFGNLVPGYSVNWAVTAGGGSISPLSVNTGSDGLAAAEWTLGATGPQTVEAQASTAITGTPVEFSATAIQLTLTSVSPDTMVEGASAVLTGDGFDLTLANNTVMIGGVAAAVTAASQTSLTVTVPAFDCKPTRTVGVQVTVGGGTSNTISHPLQPAAFVNLAVGEQFIITDPADFCFQFAASGSSEAYLIGTQSLSETPSNLTVTRLLAESGQAAPAPPIALAFPATGRAVWSTQVLDPAAERRSRHRLAEARVRDADWAVLATTSRSWAGRRSAQLLVDSTVIVGDTVADIRVWDFNTGSCDNFNGITTVVRAVGTRGIWLEDVANPADGYTQADFDSLSNYFDDVIFDTDTAFFGDPGDRDGNARVVIVVTKEVNLLATTLLGFVGSCDFFLRSQLPASNEGEFFYVKAPDPTAIHGSTYTLASAFADAPFLIAHEFTHIIQFGRQIVANAAFTRWLLEGQATLAEEMVGHVVAGRVAAQNFGHSVAFNTGGVDDIDWYSNAFIDMARYYGLSTSGTKIAEAPHECTWIGLESEGNNGPCFSLRAVYGTPSMLLGWMSDHFGPTFAGGGAGIQKALIDEVEGGFQRLENVLGRSADTLLAQWAASLYIDDRITPADTLLTHPSWNLFDIFETNSPTEWRLAPIDVVFGSFDQTINVRAGSAGYFRVSGSTRPATAVRARTSSDTTLPSTMQIWVVRLQ